MNSTAETAEEEVDVIMDFFFDRNGSKWNARPSYFERYKGHRNSENWVRGQAMSRNGEGWGRLSRSI
jgi:hypothetical protein